MPVKNDWENVKLIPDDQLSLSMIAVVKAMLALLELEKEGMVKSSVDIHEEVMEGMVFRSMRMNIEQPNDTQVWIAAMLSPYVAEMPEDEQKTMGVLLADIGIPAVNRKFE